MTPRRERDASGRTDVGMSLIEVMVALLIFAILSTGIVAGMITISKMSADNEARVVAAGLAAQDVALARAVGDPFDLVDAAAATDGVTTKAQVVGDRTFTVQRTVKIVNQSGLDVSCNTSTDLFYARVNVQVRWAGQLVTTGPVQDDTVVAPQGRINDSATGSVTVHVVGADGSPQPGVTVTLTPTNGGAALSTPIAPTDATGCTRAGSVTPGTYTVTLSKANFLDTQQKPRPSKTVVVTAGANQALSFQYDLAATYSTAYIPWPGTYTGNVLVPTNLDTTFVNATFGRFTTPAPATSVSLHPFPAGYAAIAGTPADDTGAAICAANDPIAWTGSSSGGSRTANGVRSVAAAPAGGTTDFAVTYGSVKKTGIPMGVVVVKGLTIGALITATTAAAPSGSASPGCTTTTTYTFSSLTLGTSAALLLPYGSYTLSVGVGALRTPITGSNLNVPTNVNNQGAQGNVVTLDPRPAS